MRHFCVATVDGDNVLYWVDAANEHEARRLVALNVPKAKDAMNKAIFDSFRDNGKTPPPGFIYRSNDAPISIEKR
ncbi:MAG: hypothetical protein AAGA09_01680 [Pseudomonadota bacterium]